MIHTYFTDGFYGWAEFFVRTLKHSNGEDNKLILSSRNLDQGRIDKLNNIYKNIEVRNKDLDYTQMAKRAGINENTLLAYKKETETVKVNVGNKVWKVMISAEDRLKEIREILNECSDGELILHLDIDTYVRHNVEPIFNVIRGNDFTTQWRIEKQIKRHGYVKRVNRATLNSVQGYNVNDKTKKFLDVWIKHIVKVKPSNRPKGFGQTSCYYAYLDMKDQLSWGDTAGTNFLNSVGGNRGSILWGANRGSKSETLKKYKQDFKRRLNR
jgi:hypothetical protein